MCMEDINIGRKTVSSTVSRLVVNNTVLLVPANGLRVGLRFSAHNCTNCAIVRELHPAGVPQQVLNDFFFHFLQAQNVSLMLRIEEHGQAVQLGYTMINQDGGDRVLAFTEYLMAP